MNITILITQIVVYTWHFMNITILIPGLIIMKVRSRNMKKMPKSLKSLSKETSNRKYRLSR